MSSQIIKQDRRLVAGSQELCRLCLSEEMLEDVFKFVEDDIIRQISDLLSIVVSKDDQISRSICAICRARLYEFHDYKLSCLEVQDVLCSKICPALEEDLSAPDPPQIKSEKQDDVDMENLIEEMKVLPEDIKLEAEFVKTELIERPLSPVQQNTLLISVQEPYISDSKVDKRNQLLTCSYCGKKVPRSAMRAHKDNHRLPVFKCERGCDGLKFKWRQTQLEHYVKVHNFRPVECPICHKIFRAKASLYYHTRSMHQDKAFRCTICNSSYPIKYLLDRHMKNHNGDVLEYKCSLCNYASNLRHNLYRHMRMHEKK